MAKKRTMLKLNYDDLLEQSVQWGKNIIRLIYDDYIPDRVKAENVEIKDYKGEWVFVEYRG